VAQVAPFAALTAGLILADPWPFSFVSGPDRSHAGSFSPAVRVVFSRISHFANSSWIPVVFRLALQLH
jgi:hypothetical protein